MPRTDDRAVLAEAARKALGGPAAATLMDLLVPSGDTPATKADVARLSATFEQRFDGVDTRLDGIDDRLDGIDTRLDGIDHKVTAMDKRLDVQHHELVALFRGELNHAMTSQIRAVVAGVLTSVVSIAGLSLTFASILG